MIGVLGQSPYGALLLSGIGSGTIDTTGTSASMLGAAAFGTAYYGDEFEDLAGTVVTPVVTAYSDPIGPVQTNATASSDPIGPVEPPAGGNPNPRPVQRVGVLGCGEYRAVIEPMGGGYELMRLSYSAIGFSRTWSGTGEIRINVDGVNECSEECRNLQALRPWRHELVILRDGQEASRGPLIIAETEGDSALLIGQDMSGWLNKRVIHNMVTPLVPQDATSIAVGLIYDGMVVDDRPGLVGVYKGDVGVKVAPELIPYNQTISDALQNLTQSGLAWTTVGREILCGPADIMGSQSVATFRTGDFADRPKVTGSGAMQANSWHIQPDQQAAETTGEEGAVAVAVVGHYTDPLAALEDGTLERIGRDPGVVTTEDANIVAQRNTVVTRNTPLLVEGGKLAREAGVMLEQLIPGSLFTVEDAGCFPFSQVVRLTGLSVSVKPGDEEVAVSFSPVEVAI